MNFVEARNKSAVLEMTAGVRKSASRKNRFIERFAISDKAQVKRRLKALSKLNG